VFRGRAPAARCRCYARLSALVLAGLTTCGPAYAWDPLLHLWFARTREVRDCAVEKYKDAGLPGNLVEEAYEAGSMAPDLLVLPPLSGKEAEGILAFLLGEALRPGLGQALGAKPPDLDEFKRRAALNKGVGDTYFHKQGREFARRLWSTALQEKDPKRKPRLASFALGWAAHVGCDDAFDASEKKEGTNLNDTSLLRVAILAAAWDRGGYCVREVAQDAPGRAAVGKEFAGTLVAIYNDVAAQAKALGPGPDLRRTDLESTLLPEATEGIGALAALISDTLKLAQGLGDLEGLLKGVKRPKLSPLADISVNDPLFVAERKREGKTDGRTKEERTIAQVLGIYSSAAREEAVGYIKSTGQP